jgi:tungstate transport system substrate-binding protein
MVGRVLLVALLSVLGIVAGCGEADSRAADGSATPARPPSAAVILATTTSTQDSGLLDELVPAFEGATGLEVKVIAVGSGQAIELGRRGEADVLLVHSPAAEQELMAEGRAATRRRVMHNDVVLIGPGDDPARVKGTREAAAALGRIRVAEAPFVSRGDASGTHTLELALWKAAGVEPGGAWYSESGQGMGQTIQIAGERRAYTLADRATWLAAGARSGLEVLVEGDPALLNVYHVIAMTQAAGRRVNGAGGAAFADWIISPAAQQLIGAFGVATFGRPLFVPDADGSAERVDEAA